MLDYLEGVLVHVEPDFAIIDIGGWGLKLNISMFTYNKIKTELGNKLKLYTQMVLRDDAVELFGFFDVVERQAYVLLNKVSGIGPKAAISILSLMDVARLKTSILSEDVKDLVKVPGIGKKTAQKIIIELKDRIKDLPVTSDEGMYNSIIEAREALISLGFNPMEIQLVLDEDSVKNNDSVEDIIKCALKKLSK
ncbi:Holliday junction ATP-dependent DNA helicase RuvA [Tepidanaerobacter acetatoxydans Re1]|uniref:Holliday junction branch migration complex subunit RuvA n=1 Tax=Tepidanaerobacter acetatoxydans (strain DSM 21804 / JCM 16047 / Re1) TaxID=1209989 RepID=F4LTI9_TEPAE|nr:Holliday junction branch migration protein RuvA [Tepidanaerobacter acetatoxydans]AEE91319.1 Holliday junction ATP-dependent DNA helicase ruvA [Tepidanaerobacter acetatoxydans Re1]CCP26007.1 Holliday junction ATP-dependent DNA helicase RuvA [Tepidanaerobacter acetatoxydans Re1]